MAFNVPGQGELKDIFATESMVEEFINREGNQAWLWGRGTNGQLGNNATTDINPSPVQTIAGGADWKQISAGSIHTAAVKTDGTLWLWGSNTNGRLGTNSAANRSSPVQTIAGGNDWKQVSAGYAHTAAVKTDGTLWTWGAGINGALGNSLTTARSSPVQTTTGGTDWKQVAAGCSVTIAIKTDGSLWTWGIANRNTGSLDTSVPTQINCCTGMWREVAAGPNSPHVAGILCDNSLLLWGSSNTCGLLGRGYCAGNTELLRLPRQPYGYAKHWKHVALGNLHTVASTIRGQVQAWGSNACAQLGISTSFGCTLSTTPTGNGNKSGVWVAAGFQHSAAVSSSGRLTVWGDNNDGELGCGGTNSAGNNYGFTQATCGWTNVSAGCNFIAALKVNV